MAEIRLLCEGKSDAPVLDAVFTQVLAADIIVKPCSGSTTAPSAAAYLTYHNSQVTVAYVVDRDYSRREIADGTFTDGRPRFMWRRHAIESYLLSPAVVVEAFRMLKASVAAILGGGPDWVQGLPEDESIMIQGLSESARARTPEEAMSFAIHRLWEDLSETAGRVQKRVPSVPRPPRPDAAVCRQAVIREAARVVAKAGEAAASPHLMPAAVGARYDQELARLNEDSYMNALRFLEEFNGKELLAELCGWLGREYRFRLSVDRFTEELRKALPVVYRTNRRLYGTDDFLDLANGDRALAGFPPIS